MPFLNCIISEADAPSPPNHIQKVMPNIGSGDLNEGMS